MLTSKNSYGNALLWEYSALNLMTMRNSIVKQIENIRNFVQNFRDKKITIKEFLRGPVHDEEIPEIEMLEMMLGQLLGVKF